MHVTSMGDLRGNNSVNSSSIIINGSSISINSSSSNSTTRTPLSSSRSSSINSRRYSLAHSSRTGSISSNYSNGSNKSSNYSETGSSRALVKTSVTSISSGTDSDSIRSRNLDLPGVFVCRLTRTLSLDSSKPEMPSTTHTLTVPFVQTHQCHFRVPKIPSHSLYIDKHNTKGIDMDVSKDDQNLINGKLYNPIWIKPLTGMYTSSDREAKTYTCSDRESCQPEHCKCSIGVAPEKPERCPDFTLTHSYRTPRRPPRRCPCKCGSITIMTCIFSLFVLFLILGFVVYTETVIKAPSLRIYYKM